MRVALQTSLPTDPDEVKDTSPPGAVLLVGTNAVQLTLAASAGAVTATPYWWNGTNWAPLRGDTATGTVDIRADSASIAVANQTFYKASEPRWWTFLKSGAGTASYCDVEEAVL